MVYICTKFYENMLNSFRVIERTRKVNRRTDRQTDRQTDGRKEERKEGRTDGRTAGTTKYDPSYNERIKVTGQKKLKLDLFRFRRVIFVTPSTLIRWFIFAPSFMKISYSVSEL